MKIDQSELFNGKIDAKGKLSLTAKQSLPN